MKRGGPTNAEVLIFICDRVKELMKPGVGMAALVREGYPFVNDMSAGELLRFAARVERLDPNALWHP